MLDMRGRPGAKLAPPPTHTHQAKALCIWKKPGHKLLEHGESQVQSGTASAWKECQKECQCCRVVATLMVHSGTGRGCQHFTLELIHLPCADLEGL